MRIILKKYVEDLIVQKRLLTVITRNQRVFVSLTDMAKIKSYKPGIVIANWLNTKKTIAFLEAWEGEHNPQEF